jgi:hypothetical protein
MERIDQGHHPKLEVPRQICFGRESNPGFRVGGQHSNKELFKKRVICYSE